MTSAITSMKVHISPIIMTMCTLCLSLLSGKRSFYNPNTYFLFLITVSLQIQRKIKGKLFHVHGMKAYKASRGTAPLILNYGYRWKRMRDCTLRPLEPRYTLLLKLGGRGEGGKPVRTFRKREEILPTTGIWTPDSRAPSAVPTPPALPPAPCNVFPNLVTADLWCWTEQNLEFNTEISEYLKWIT